MENIENIPEGVLTLFSSVAQKGVQFFPTQSGQVRAKLMLTASNRQQLVPYIDLLFQYLAIPCFSLELASPGLRSVTYSWDVMLSSQKYFNPLHLGYIDVLDSIPEAFLVLDNDGIVRFANASPAKIGLTGEEMLNRPIYKFFPAEEMVDILWEAFRHPYRVVDRAITATIKSLPRQFSLKACSNQQEYWLILRRFNSYWT